MRDFSDVKTGDIGGSIESEDNLSHHATARVDGNARVDDNARVKTLTTKNPIDEWFSFTLEEIHQMDGDNAIKFWLILKEMTKCR